MSSITFTETTATVLNDSTANGHLSSRLFTRKEIITPNQNVLWRIDRGVVRTLTWSEDGTFITLGYWGAGDLIGYPLSKINPYQIECLTSVEAIAIPQHHWHKYTNDLLAHIQYSEELLSIVHRKPVALRLWQFLVWLSEKFGRDLTQGRLIELYITHQEIAEVLNTTRVTVTRLLQQFEVEGALVRYKRRIILCLSNKKIMNIS
ncbi:Crp/Fnr family transcriptional regulator [Anabaena azotica]|uniref:Crp/Fnr family transcriptional regulator n=1 Tax=Anabaena azotica FACHB-119 TaxID=947527 RepID=A0ABR8D2G6_9NOST|nr:Crp/Fnr family transcriptional regulator [Anabaena azotica]MBD2500512.1 Crp/Fnr family transcriptional regulator [Anabaena azotica FACHB-119]